MITSKRAAYMHDPYRPASDPRPAGLPPQANLALDVEGVAEKVVVLKTYYPRLNLSSVLSRYPKVLLQDRQQLEKSAAKVCRP